MLCNTLLNTFKKKNMQQEPQFQSLRSNFLAVMLSICVGELMSYNLVRLNLESRIKPFVNVKYS